MEVDVRMELDIDRAVSGLLGIADLLDSADRSREAAALRVLCLDLDEQVNAIRTCLESDSGVVMSGPCLGPTPDLCSGPQRNYNLRSRRISMLVITRRVGEAVQIGDDITIHVMDDRAGSQVRLGINAPRDVRILRSELAPHSPAEDQAVTAEVGDEFTRA